MSKKYSNPCIRCGKERIVARVWKEKMGNSVIINTETKCPDPECQKIVDSDNKRVKDKHLAMKLKSEQRAQQRQVDRNIEKARKEKKKGKKG